MFGECGVGFMGPRGHRWGPGKGWGGPGRGRGRGGWQQADLPNADDASAWFAGRLPEGWVTESPVGGGDREEINDVAQFPALEVSLDDAPARAAGESGRISHYREETRDERIEIARQAEHRYGRKVAWGAKLGNTEELFTTLSVPVMKIGRAHV